MESLEFEIVEMELKYCERCGGLWLRPQDSGEVYCESCVPKMADLPVPKKRSCQARIDELEINGWADESLFVCAEGGNA